MSAAERSPVVGARERLMAEMARRELARRSFSDYLAYVQGPMWVRTRMSEYLAGRIQAFLEEDTGRAYDVLVIETPPQHGKSMTVTETLPSWWLGRHPRGRVILASYNEETAERFCRRNKDKLRRFGPTLFGVGVGAVDRATELELDNGVGRMISRGMLSGITGNPANLILIDDPVKNRQEADSETYRRRVWEEWQNSLKSRLAAKGKVIVIMTPWHEDDLAARLLRSERSVRLLRLPVEAEEDDPLGRAPGQALCPELGKDEAWLADFKAGYVTDAKGGARAWQALYQCRPRAEGGNLVPRRWWRSYAGPPPAMGCVVISLDAAFKDGAENDFVALTVWGKRGNDYYLLECVNEHLNFPATLQAVRRLHGRFPTAAVLVEDKANGSAVIQVLQAELFCVPVEPRGGKAARVHAVSPAIESGHVFVPEGAPWLEAYLEQWCAFPAGAHDDMVDSSTQALAWLLRKSGEPVEPARAGPAEPEDGADAPAFDAGALYDVYGQGGWPV